MIIWSDFRMGQYRDDSLREDAPHFTTDSKNLNGPYHIRLSI